MKILHIWDVAGVSVTLAKFQRKLGHEAEVIIREGFDSFKIHEFYKPTLFTGSALEFYRSAIKHSQDFDVVHIHSLSQIVPFIRKPKVLNFHGSDAARPGLIGRVQNWIGRKLADRVLVSTPDMIRLVPRSEWLPHAVDTDHFYPRETRKPEFRDLELTFTMGGYPNAYQLEGTGQPVPFVDMPDYLLSKDEYVEPESKKPALSKVSYEALACGIPVVWNNVKIVPPLAKMYHGLEVAKRTIEIYEEIQHREKLRRKRMVALSNHRYR